MAMTTLAEEYKQTFTEAAEGLRQRAQALQQTNPQEELNRLKAQYEPQVEAMKQAVTNLEPTEVPVETLARFYSWLSICLTGSTLAAMIAGPIVSPFLSLAGVSTALSIWLASLAVPYIVINYGLTQQDNKMAVFYGAVASGLLLGHGLSGCYFTNWTAPVSLIPTGMTAVLSLGGASLGNDRRALLGATVGVPVATVLAVGLVVGALDATYFLFTLAFAAVFAVNMQLRLADKQAPTEAESAIVLGGCTFVSAVLSLALSVSKEAAQQGAQQQAANAK